MIEYLFRLSVYMLPDKIFNIAYQVFAYYIPPHHSRKILYAVLISPIKKKEISNSFKLYLLLDTQIKALFNVKYFCFMYDKLISRSSYELLIIAYEYRNILKYISINIKTNSIITKNGQYAKMKHNTCCL